MVGKPLATLANDNHRKQCHVVNIHNLSYEEIIGYHVAIVLCSLSVGATGD